MKSFLRKLLPDRHPLRLAYHYYKAIAASLWYSFPSRGMKVIAVTGTNGKTTTANFIAHILKHSGKKVGLLTTVNFMIDDLVEINDTKQSTQSPWALQKKIKEMKKAGCEYLILEATSHALVQHRLWGIAIDTAVFTNLTADHENYHGSMEAYRDAKGLLFKQMMSSERKEGVPKTAVINMDDEYSSYFSQLPAENLLEYGLEHGAYRALIQKESLEGMEFLLKVPNAEALIRLPMIGKVNVMNALAAASVCLAHGLSMDSIQKALHTVPAVPGRLESIEAGQPFKVLVDYAHTPDALEQVLKLLAAQAKGRVILVFGATGGGRDEAKRPLMGTLAMKLVDVVILTDDDPYDENPLKIIVDIWKGTNYHSGIHLISDRACAIDFALRFAQEGDIVLIAGKGAEPYQVRRQGFIPFDDRKVVRDWFQRERHIDFTPTSYDASHL